MSLNPAATVIPAYGTVFLGGPHAIPPTFIEFAALNPAISSTYPGFECLGHTSRENTVKTDKTGGDQTTKGSWWDPNLDVSTDDESFSFEVSSLQVDELTLRTAWPTGRITTDGRYVIPSTKATIERSVIVLATNGLKRFGWYHPRVALSLGSAPEISTDGFFEINLAGTALSSAETIASAEILPGDLTVMYPPSALAEPDPVISTATPPSAAVGTRLTINGLNLAGTTGITAGGSALTSLIQVNPYRVSGLMPAGTAGPAALVVTTPAGASASFPYTRGA